MRVSLSIIFIVICITALCVLSSGEQVISSHAKQHRICKTPGCIDAARRISQNMDKTVSPCDNFYQFACGNYMNSPKILYTTVGIETNERRNMQIKDSIEKKIHENDCRTLQLLKSHYFTCLDNERTSMELLLDTLEQLDGWPVLVGKSWNESTFDWQDVIDKLRRIGYKDSVKSFVNLDIELDPKNMKYVPIMDKAVTGFSQEELINGFESKAVQTYYEYMVNISTALGADRRFAKKELMDSLKFEIDLAKISLPGYYIRLEARQLESEFPDIPWYDYINALLWPSHIVESNEHVAAMHQFLKDLGKLILKTPKRILANYVLWRVVKESMPFMPEEFKKNNANIQWRLFDVKSEVNKWQQCLKYLQDYMPLAVGALYVRKNFHTDFKKEGEKLVNNVHHSFKDSLEKLEWMDKKTKRAALRKLKSLYSHVAYPDELLDDNIIDKYYENLKLVPDNYLDSYLSVSQFNMDKLYQKIGKIYNKTSWITHGVHSATGLIHYNGFENSFTIPAGSFQEEQFAIDRPNYLNYGSMGYVVGHELTHAFDHEGSKRDWEGNLVNWWDDKTLKEFEKRKKCLLHQYNNYTIEPLGINVNGAIGLGEIIADNGGIKQAYSAYEEYEKLNGAEPYLPGLSFSPRQLFWIQGANYHCAKYSPEILKLLYTTDKHPIGPFRVIGPFSNMPKFAKDFKCPLGSPMNPIKKCTIW